MDDCHYLERQKPQYEAQYGGVVEHCDRKTGQMMAGKSHITMECTLDEPVIPLAHSNQNDEKHENTNGQVSRSVLAQEGFFVGFEQTVELIS